MQLPPPHVTRAVIQRYARLQKRYAHELGTRPLVLPNRTFFPDTFQNDAPSLERIVQRMQSHAGMEDIPIRSAVVTSQSPTGTGGCSSGACAVPASATSGSPRLVDEGTGWCIQVPDAELRHPIALTTNLARSLAFIFLVETQEEGERLEPPMDVTADFVAVALGFGPLMLQGAYIYAKSCGGPRIGSVTTVNLNELALAVALFAALGEHPLAPALKELDVTQKAALSEAQALFRSNRSLVELFKKQPEQIASGHFTVESPTNFLTSWFRKKRSPAAAPSFEDLDPSMDLAELESLLISMPPSSQVQRESRRPPGTSSGIHSKDSAELRELVEEALKATRLEA